jgi:hypothetical protein
VWVSLNKTSFDQNWGMMMLVSAQATPVAELAALGWQARTEDPPGVKLVVTNNDPRRVVKLKALGFLGIMVRAHIIRSTTS